MMQQPEVMQQDNPTYAQYAKQWRYFNSVEDGARVSKGWFKVVPAEYLNMASIMMMRTHGTMQMVAAICTQVSSRPSRARSMHSVTMAVWLMA